MAEIEHSLRQKFKSAIDCRRHSHSPPPRRHSDAHSHRFHSASSHSRAPSTYEEPKATLHRVDSANSTHESSSSFPHDLEGRSRLLIDKLNLLITAIRDCWIKKGREDQSSVKRLAKSWGEGFYDSVRPRDDFARYLMDDKNFGKILDKVAELERDHASQIIHSGWADFSIPKLYRPEHVVASLHLTARPSPHSPGHTKEKGRRHRFKEMFGSSSLKKQNSLSHEDFRISHRQAARHRIETRGDADSGGHLLVSHNTGAD